MEAVALIPLSALGSALGYLLTRLIEHRLLPHTTLNVETRREVAKLKVETLRRLSSQLHAYWAMDPDELESEDFTEAWKGMMAVLDQLGVLLPKDRYKELRTRLDALSGYLDDPAWPAGAERVHDYIRAQLLDV
ncbi:MAG: hypothetical protein RLZZ450_6973 [Pseudomonadota bacterium]|jgi:hypothetical protein